MEKGIVKATKTGVPQGGPISVILSNVYLDNRKYKNGFNEESIFKVANSRLGWYKRSSMDVVNYILNPELLETKIKDGAGLLNPLNYYLRKVGI
ncbi:hypothetical protein [Lacrimispora sp.]|uniref:hypothetical protein n=1 Tax=Lacrimispora sp. TaxID=2719234 RepID=UPI0029DFCDB5|nr:RNA-directed polymerase [Lacrimispora sp.]